MAKEAPKGEETLKTYVDWHSVMAQAFAEEMGADKKPLEMTTEFPLKEQPRRIDGFAIIDDPKTVARNTIAKGLGKYSIIEFKGRSDYISVQGYHRTISYAHEYVAMKKEVSRHDVAVTIIGPRYPRKLIKYLTEELGRGLENPSPGIYTISGETFALQIVNIRELPRDEYPFLWATANPLDGEGLLRIAGKLEGEGRLSRMGPYFKAIIETNPDAVQEATNMSVTTKRFDSIMEQTGLAAKWEARGRNEGREEVARNMIGMGLPTGMVVSATGLDARAIARLKKVKA